MIIFLYGEDTYRSRLKLVELKGKFLREVDRAGSSLAVIDGEIATAEKINEVASSPSLFAKKRMIVVERLFANKSKTVLEQVHEYLKKSQGVAGKSTAAAKNREKAEKTPVSENIIIFWENTDGPGKLGTTLWRALAGERYAQNFKPLSNTETVNWIKNEAQNRGGKIRQQAAVTLAALVGNDLWQLSNEIDKLIHYKQGGEKLIKTGDGFMIETGDVEALVKAKLDENIFALTDAIGSNNKALALKLFEQELDSGMADSYLVHMISRQFRILLMVRQGLDKGDSSRQLASRLRIHPFVIQKSLGQVRNFTLPVLKNIFRALVKIDMEMKTGRMEARTALSMLLAKI